MTFRVPARAPLSAVLLACVIASVSGCSEDAATRVDLDVLVAQQESFDGRRVTTAGVLREFDDPHHVWIEDEALHRVELRPSAAFAGRAGEAVEVTGRFSFAADRGRRIEVDLDPPP